MLPLRIDFRLFWRVCAGFLAVFLATYAMQLLFGVGLNQFMRWLAVSPDVRTYLGATLNRGGVLALMVFFTALGMKRFLGISLSATAFRRHAGWWQDLLFGLLLASAVMGILFAVEISQGWLVVKGWGWQSDPQPVWLRSLWTALLANLDAGVGEEVLFRGFLQTGMQKVLGKWGGLGLVTVLFAAVHLTVAGSAETNWLLFTVMLSVPAFLLGYTYLRSGSLWLGMGIHFTWDLAYDVLNFTGGNHVGLFGAIADQRGPAWIVGTDYGIEVGLAGVVVAVLIMGGVWFWTRNR
jgi:membrane protease YdiL (CAAX protease family)